MATEEGALKDKGNAAYPFIILIFFRNDQSVEPGRSKTTLVIYVITTNMYIDTSDMLTVILLKH